MLNIFKELLKKGGADSDKEKDHSPEKELQVATCALLLEMAHADDEFAPEEEKQIEDLMRSHFDLPQETFNEIKELSDKQRAESIDLWHFAKIIKDNYSVAEKEKVIEMIWTVVYADNNLDDHEDYLVHQLAQILNLEHKQLIDAKVKVLKRTKIN